MGHTLPLGRQDHIRLRQPRIREAITDELDLNAPGHRPLAGLLEIRAHRRRRHRAQRHAARPRTLAQTSDQRRRQPHREHHRALRHHHTIRPRQRLVHIPTPLTLRQTELRLQPTHRIRRRETRPTTPPPGSPEPRTRRREHVATPSAPSNTTRHGRLLPTGRGTSHSNSKLPTAFVSPHPRRAQRRARADSSTGRKYRGPSR